MFFHLLFVLFLLKTIALGATQGAADDECSLGSVVVASSGGKMIVDLSKATCIIMNADIRSAFEGNKNDACSWNQVFFKQMSECPGFYRNMMIPFHNKIKIINDRLSIKPLFLLQICRIGGAFKKTYEQGGTCEVVHGEDIQEQTIQYILTRQGVQICREARVKAIERCAKTHDPLSHLATAKRTQLLCAEKFKQMLRTSGNALSRHINTVPKFSNAEAKLLMSEEIAPFGLEKKSTWINDDEDDDSEGTTTPVDTVATVVFQRNDNIDKVLDGVRALFKTGRHGVLTPTGRRHFLNMVGSSLFQGDTLPKQMNRIHRLVGEFLQAAFDGKEDAMMKFIQSKWFGDPWPSLKFNLLKTKLRKLFRHFSSGLKALQPSISNPEWNDIREMSAILDKDLVMWSGRAFIIYSISTVTNDLKVLQEGLNPTIASFHPKNKANPLFGGFMELSDQTAFMYSKKIPYENLIKPYSKWLFVRGRLIFETSSSNPAVPSHPVSNMDYYNEENRLEACRETTLHKMCALCAPDLHSSAEVSRCKRQSRFNHHQYNINGIFKGSNVQIKYTKGKERKLVVFVDVRLSVWLAVMNALQINVDEKQKLNIVITDYDKAVAKTLLPFQPKQVYDTNMHCDGDALDVNRNSDSQKGTASLTLWSCVTKWKKSSGLTKNKRLVFWMAILPGKDNYENNNGFFHAGGGFRMIRETMTSILVDYEGNYWGHPLSFTVDSMFAEAICGGYGCRASHDIPGCPPCERDDKGIATDSLNTGATTEAKVQAYINSICGINRVMEGKNILKMALVDIKAVVGLEMFITHWPTCKAALQTPRSNPLTFKHLAEPACEKIFKVAQPSKKFNRITRLFGVPSETSTWGTPVIDGVVVFWCKKSNARCKVFFQTLSSAFYAIPNVPGATPATPETPATPATPATPNNDQAPDNMPSDDLAELGDGEADGDDEETHAADADTRDPNVMTPTGDSVQIKEDFGGYHLILPSTKDILEIDQKYLEYIEYDKERIGLGLPIKKARATVLQYYIQDAQIRQQHLDNLRAKVENAPISTKDERKEKLHLSNQLKSMDALKTSLGGLKELLYLLERDAISSLCVTPTSIQAKNLIQQMKDVVEFKLDRDTPGEQKKVRKELFKLISTKRRPKLPAVGLANSISEWNQWAKGKNVMYQKHPLLLGPLQFDQDKLGQCANPDSFHTGLRCYGSSFEGFVIQVYETFDSKCTVVGESRMTCLKKKVQSVCGTWIGPQLNAGKNARNKVKKNGGWVFKKCLLRMDWSSCFKPDERRSKIDDSSFCAPENERSTMTAVTLIQKMFRFTHWFDFVSDDRAKDFGYADDDTAGTRENMRADRKKAASTAFDILKEICPTTVLTMTRQIGGNTVTTTRDYNPFMTRNCRYAGAFMLALFDEGIDTNDENADMSERTNGDLRRQARHHTMRNWRQARQLLVSRATFQRQYLSSAGGIERFVQLYQKKVPDIATTWNPLK